MDYPDSCLYWKETGGGERSNIEKSPRFGMGACRFFFL